MKTLSDFDITVQINVFFVSFFLVYISSNGQQHDRGCDVKWVQMKVFHFRWTFRLALTGCRFGNSNYLQISCMGKTIVVLLIWRKHEGLFKGFDFHNVYKSPEDSWVTAIWWFPLQAADHMAACSANQQRTARC